MAGILLAQLQPHFHPHSTIKLGRRLWFGFNGRLFSSLTGVHSIFLCMCAHMLDVGKLCARDYRVSLSDSIYCAYFTWLLWDRSIPTQKKLCTCTQIPTHPLGTKHLWFLWPTTCSMHLAMGNSRWFDSITVFKGSGLIQKLNPMFLLLLGSEDLHTSHPPPLATSKMLTWQCRSP